MSNDRSQAELLEELAALRSQVAELEALRRQIDQAREAEREARAELETTSNRLRQAMSLDPLTQALNRKGLEQVLEAELKQTRRTGSHPMAVLLDCVDFKHINRRFGHAIGDDVLVETARRIQSALRSSDHIARVGADEFLIVLPDTGYWEAVRIAERIRVKVSAPLPVGGPEPLAVTPALGVCAIPRVEMTLEQVLELAHAALAKGKKAREQAPAGFLEGGGLETLVELLSAEGTYHAVQEPIVQLASGGVTGYEMLARTRIDGFERPGDFLQMALAHNVLTVADLHCLKVCLGSVATAPKAAMDYHVNLFPSTILNTPPERLLASLKQSWHERLCIEITEQQFFGDSKALRERLAAVRDAGIRVALDDVGFGRTSLELLILLAPDVVKIDQRFIKDVWRDPFKTTALRRLIDVINTLGATAIAEGIETAEDEQAVQELGVPYAQGFLWRGL
jgi:diguanylate cyclase (GGDEF)-like protein